jgi:hypothetical protein
MFPVSNAERTQLRKVVSNDRSMRRANDPFAPMVCGLLSVKRMMSRWMAGMLSMSLVAGCGGLESDMYCDDEGNCEGEELGESIDAACGLVSPDALYNDRACATAYNSSTSIFAIDGSYDKDYAHVTNNGFNNSSKFVVKAQSIPINCSVWDVAGVAPIASSNAAAFGTCTVNWNATGSNKYYLMISMNGTTAPANAVFGEKLSKFWQIKPVDDEFANQISSLPFELHLNPAGYTKMKGGIQQTTDSDTLSFKSWGYISRLPQVHHFSLTNLSSLGSSKVSVYDSYGALVGSAESVGGSVNFSLSLNRSAIHFVKVTGMNSNTGDFNLEIQADN